jgi:hypothetical protein
VECPLAIRSHEPSGTDTIVNGWPARQIAVIDKSCGSARERLQPGLMFAQFYAFQAHGLVVAELLIIN